MYNIPLLLGTTPTGAAQGTSQGSMVQFMMIAAVIAVFWFLIIKPQRKKQKETKSMLAALKKGDRVTSIGGIRGVVKNVSEQGIVVEVDNKGNTLEFLKTAISSVNSGETPPASSQKKAKAEPVEESGSNEQ